MWKNINQIYSWHIIETQHKCQNPGTLHLVIGFTISLADSQWYTSLCFTSKDITTASSLSITRQIDGENGETHNKGAKQGIEAFYKEEGCSCSCSIYKEDVDHSIKCHFTSLELMIWCSHIWGEYLATYFKTDFFLKFHIWNLEVLQCSHWPGSHDTIPRSPLECRKQHN